MARYKLQGIARDGAGNVISDASVAVYLSGTTTAASIYEASSGGTAVNSVDTDSAGYYYFYVDSTDYSFSQNFKVIISKTGYTSKTFDEISIFPTPMLMDSDVDDLTVNGITVTGALDASIATSVSFGDILYMKSSGDYDFADASTSSTMPCIVMAAESGDAGDSIELLTIGYARNDTWSLTPGNILYVSTVAGDFTATAPSTAGEQVQSIGVATSTSVVYFNPNDVLVEIDDGTALIPTGGTTGQVLMKDSGTDYDVSWTTIYQMESGGTTGQVLEKASNTNYDVQWATPTVYNDKVVQVVHTEDGTLHSCTTAIPLDNTIPQNTEGDEVMSLSITPSSATNKLYVEAILMVATNSTDIHHIAALFKDSDADAISAATVYTSWGSDQIYIRHEIVAGTVSAITFSVRLGNSVGTSTVTYLNGDNTGTLLFNGIVPSNITITEIKV